jgi:hypothetical protein
MFVNNYQNLNTKMIVLMLSQEQFFGANIQTVKNCTSLP